MIMDERTQKALETAQKLFGDKMPSADVESTGVPMEFAMASFGHVFGEIWPREGLDLKTRSLITVAALVACDKPSELHIHLQGALNIGWTREELTELMIHLSYYTSFPNGIEGVKVLEAIFRDEKEAE